MHYMEMLEKGGFRQICMEEAGGGEHERWPAGAAAVTVQITKSL
jgi:hypothetical protein